MTPTYRNIKRFPGYRVGDDGTVWSYLPWRGRQGGEWYQLKPAPYKNSGHVKVTLSYGRRRAQRGVHQLVLEAFVGPCPDGMECCHYPDRNPANNRLENLRYGTRLDNVQDMMKHGTHFTPFAKPPSVGPSGVRRVRRLSEAGHSTRAIAKQLHLTKSTVWQIVAKKGVYQEENPCPA